MAGKIQTYRNVGESLPLGSGKTLGVVRELEEPVNEFNVLGGMGRSLVV